MRITGTNYNIVGEHTIVTHLNMCSIFLGTEMNCMRKGSTCTYNNRDIITLHPKTTPWANMHILAYYQSIIISPNSYFSILYNTPPPLYK